VGAGLLALSNTAALAAADDAYTANDVLLFLQNPAGAVGNDKVAYFSLGNTVSVFRDSAAGSVTNLGNINTTLNATFGSDWADKASTIFVGAAGQQGSTSATNTGVTNGDYARTVYVTKARSGVGTIGQANSASPLFDPSQTGVAGQIAGSNLISGMTQPGSVAFGDTLIEGYNPFSNGNPSTAYGAISGGIQNSIGNSTLTFGSVTNVVTALDLYRVTKTTGTNATNANTALWHVSNNKTATYSNNSYPGSNGARADYLGTITLSSDGSVNFLAAQSGGVVPNAPVINSAATANGTVGAPFNYTITATNTPTGFDATPLPAGFSVNATSGVISGTPTAAGNYTINISAINSGGTGNITLSLAIARGIPVINTPPTATAITAGQPLSASSLTGGNASVAGNFDFTSPAFIPSATSTQLVTFTPSDTTNYTTASTSVTVTVNPAPLSPFDSWTGGNVSLTNSLIAIYAIGGGSYNGTTAPQVPVTNLVGGNLTITAIIRTNDPALTVTAEHTNNLTTWTPIGNGTITGVDQTGCPPNHERRAYSVPIGTDTKKFLRLRASINSTN
jgi:hypothetical protein